MRRGRLWTVCARVALDTPSRDRSSLSLTARVVRLPDAGFFTLVTMSAFTLTCAIATVATLTVTTWRHLLPLIWRVWVWGIVGFAAAHALITCLIMLLVPVDVRIAGGPPSHIDFRTSP
jgi:hypothetical protein